MKQFFAIAALMGLLSFNVWAVDPYPVYTCSGSAGALSSAIVGCNSTGGWPLVTYINATSDLSTSYLTNYVATSGQAMTNANSTVTLYVNATNIASGTVVVIRHTSADTYERRIVDASTGTAGTLAVTAAPTTACAAGDYLYVMAIKSKIPVGAANLALGGTGGGVINGTKDMPILIDLPATSSGCINAVCAEFRK